MSKMILVSEATLQQAAAWAERYSQAVFAGGGMAAVDEMNAWYKSIQAAPAAQQEPVSVQQILAAFPLLVEEGLDQQEHHCEWALQQDRKRLHTMFAALLAQPEQDVDLHFMKQVLGVAIGGLYEQYTDEALRVFTIEQLEKIVDYTEPLRSQQVEDVYKKAWDMLHTAPQAPQPAIPQGWHAVQVIGDTTNVWPMTEEQALALSQLQITPPAQQKGE